MTRAAVPHARTRRTAHYTTATARPPTHCSFARLYRKQRWKFFAAPSTSPHNRHTIGSVKLSTQRRGAMDLSALKTIGTHSCGS